MRRIPRLTQSIDWLSTSGSSRVCRACQLRLNARNPAARQRFSTAAPLRRESARPTTLTETRHAAVNTGESSQVQAANPASALQNGRRAGDEVPPTEEELRELEELEQYEDEEFQPAERYQVLLREPMDDTGKRLPDFQAEPRKLYEEAKTWDGLEWWGTKEHIYEQERARLVEDLGGFRGYAPATKMKRESAVREVVMRAVKEVLFLKALGRPFGHMQALVAGNEVEDGLRPSWSDNVELVVEEAGAGYELRFASKEDLQEALEMFRSETQAIDQLPADLERTLQIRGTLDASSTRASLAAESAGQTWETINIEALPMKFALSKRIFQLTGLRVLDNDLRTTTTTGTLFRHLVKLTRPQDPKLAQVLEALPSLETLPNVKIERRRVTPIDKEKAVGRWKVIERELVERGLPVTGRE